MSNKKVILVIGFVVFLLTAYISKNFFGGAGSLLRSPLSKYKTPTSNSTPGVDTGPKTEACPINGQLYSKNQRDKWEKRRPLLIMIENHTEARPQSGMSSADVIYEAVAEGGITRFLNVFYCNDAPFVGPVRSARIYFVRLAEGYGDEPLYAHVGGANTDGPADALGEIEDLGWAGHNDLNEFSVPFPNFYRDYDRLPDRATEHTMYTSTQKLWTFAAAKRGLSNENEDGVAWDKTFEPWKFADDAKTGDRGVAGSISFGFWSNLSSDFSVKWTYDPTTNSYTRAQGGAPFIDKNTGKAINSKDVVVVFADESPANDGYEGGHILYDVIGKGDALIFQNGQAIKGSWTKKDEESRMYFSDAKGKEVELVRGQVFVEILPIGNKVTY